MHLQCLHISAIIDNQLQKEFIDRLEMRPSRIGQSLFLIHSNTLPRQALFLEHRQRPKDILLDHVDDQVEMRDDYRGHAVLIIQVIVELLKVGLSVILLLDLLAIVIEVQWI